MIKLNDSGVVFNSTAHTYKLGDKILRGVTTAITREYNPHFMRGNFEELPIYVQNNITEATEYGTKVHDAIEGFLKDDILFNPDAQEELNLFIEMLESEGLKPIASEYLVTDYKEYASAIDIVCLQGDDVILCDTKTSRTVSKKQWAVQLTMYKIMFELVNPHLKVSGARVIQLNDREGKERITKVHDIELLDENQIIEFYNRETEIVNSGEKQLPAELDKLLNQLTLVQIEIDEAEKKKKEFRKRLHESLNEFGLAKLENDNILITKRDAYVRESFDSKRFKDEYPELYEEFKKESNVSESIQIRLK